MIKNTTYIFFILLGFIWGSNFIYMKLTSDYLSEMQIVLIRVFFGFIPVLLYAYKLKVIKIEHIKYSFHFFMMSLLGTSVYYYFFIKASSILLSGVTGAFHVKDFSVISKLELRKKEGLRIVKKIQKNR